MQFNQPSFFEALTKITENALLTQKSDHLYKLYQIHLRILDHLTVNCDLKNTILSVYHKDLLKLIEAIP